MTTDTQVCLASHRSDPDRPRLAVEGTVLCVGHGRRLTEQLQQLPGLRQELEDAMARPWGEVISDDPTPLAIAEKAIPLQPDIADLRGEIESQVMSYARMVAGDLDATWPPKSLDRVIPWILDRFDVAARQEWIVDMAEGVDDLVRQAHGFLDAAKHRYVYLGKCEGDGACEEPLFATVKTGEGRDETLPASVVCAACEEEHDVMQRVAFLARMVTGYGNARQVAEAAGVKWGTVRAWASEGRLARHGKDVRGRPVYRVADVLALKNVS